MGVVEDVDVHRGIRQLLFCQRIHQMLLRQLQLLQMGVVEDVDVRQRIRQLLF